MSATREGRCGKLLSVSHKSPCSIGPTPSSRPLPAQQVVVDLAELAPRSLTT